MLKFFKGLLKGWGGYVFLALVFVAFTFVGISQIGSIFSSAALKVGDTKYSIQEVNGEFDRQLRIEQRNTQTAISREEAVERGMVNQVIRVLRERASLKEDAQQLGVTATPEMVQTYLSTNEAFQVNGKFDNDALTRLLQANDMGPTEFRAIIKDDLKRNQIIQSVSSPVPAAEPLMNLVLLRNGELRSISYFVVDAAAVADGAAPTDDQLNNWYQQNIAQFTKPEYRSFAVTSLSINDFIDQVNVSEEDIVLQFEARKDTLVTPETRTVRQLTSRTEAAANALKERLDAGESFAALVAERGLSLDAVTNVDATKTSLNAIGDAAFSAEPNGTVIGPIETPLGYALVQVLSMTPGQDVTFEDLKEDLRKELAADEAQRLLFEAVERIELARDIGTSVRDAALDVPEATTKNFGPVDATMFTPGGAIVDGLSGAALAEAFLLPEGEDSNVLETDDNDGYYFVSIDAITPATPTPMAEIRDQVEAGWRKEQTSTLALAKAAELRAKISSGEPIAKVAADAGFEFIQTNINRVVPDATLPVPLMNNLFQTDINGLAVGVAKDEISQIVAKVTGAQLQPIPDNPQIMAQGRVQFGQILAGEFSTAYLTTLDEELGVKVNQGQISQAFGLNESQ